MELISVDDALRSKVYELFDRTKKTVDEDVLIIKKWMQTQPHLPETMDDRKIINFLVMNKFSIEKSKQKIDMYYSLRHITPEFFQAYDPDSEKLKTFLDNTFCCIHPKLVDEMYRVFFFKSRVKDTFDILELVQLVVNIAEIRIMEDVMVGEIMVLDMEITSLFDIRKITPTIIAKVFALYEKVYSLRLKGIYLLNSPSYASILLKILKQVLKPKLFDRIKVDNGIESLKNLFSQDDLPKDYGGNGPSLEKLQDMTCKKLNQYTAWFKTIDKLKTKEDLRPGKLNNDEILGFYGTFKKLNLD